MFNPDELREDFPHLKSGQIYFNHASCGPMSNPVRIALENLIKHKSKDEINNYSKLVSIASETKKILAEMINCSPDRIAFVDNTTNGINILAQGIKLNKGDRILLNDAEFPANIYPFLNLKSEGIEIDFVNSENGIVTAEDVINSIKPETKLVAISIVQFLSGYRVDLEVIGNYCRQKNIIFSVDGIQGLGAITLDVEKCGIDFLSCGTQKWLLGLEGMAFVYVNKSLQEKIKVTNAGWLAVKDAWNLLDYNLEFRNSASRFQPGTINTFGVYALNASLSLFKKYGFKEIEKSVILNSEHFMNCLNNIGIKLILKDVHKKYFSGIVSFKSQNGEKIFNYLSEKNIICTLRANHIRFSPHFYNNNQEIDKVVDELKKNINFN